MVKHFITKLLDGLTSRSLRQESMNYTDLSQGLRHPRSPSGVLVQDDGNVQVYAGSSRILSDQKSGSIAVDANQIQLQGRSINISPSSIDDFSILGRCINRDIFYSRKPLATLKTKSISELSLINPLTYVDAKGNLQDTTPLSDIIEPVDFTHVPTSNPELLNTATIMAGILGHELPKVFKKLGL